MKILAPVKLVPDYNVRLRLRADGGGVDLDNVRMILNPFDEIAVEAAVRLREAGVAAEVVVVSCGAAAVVAALRQALAMGADSAIHVASDSELQPLAAAKLLRAVCLAEQPQLVICGKQAVDDDANQTAQMLAAMLGWPQAVCASNIEVSGAAARVETEVDGGRETLQLALPALISTDLRLNEPRFASLGDIMRAKKKPLQTLTPQQLQVDVAPRLQTLAVVEPAPRAGAALLADGGELAAVIKQCIAEA